MELRNKNTSVIGMGRTGIAAANFLASRGARATLIDQKNREDLKEALASLNPAVETRFGSSRPRPDAEVVVLSPGVDIHDPVLQPARESGAEILSEIELAARFASSPIIAVTGTNGKSTVTALIGEILKRAGKKILVGGNIGTPFISLVDDEPADYLVLEISSFQLEGVSTFRPKIGMILNISPDHMDRHKTLEEYSALKGKIAANQQAADYLVLNQDDPETLKLGKGKQARKAFFSASGEVEEGSFVRDGTLFVRRKGEDHEVCPAGELKQAMQWQMESVLAAVTAAALAGIEHETIADAIRAFSGLEHRMEWVRSVRGIDFVNNSKGTNVGSVQKSLNSFDRPVILIAGGSDKDSDFAPLKSVFKERVKHLVLMGETRKKFRQILNGSFSYEDAEDMEEAVSRAYQKAAPGDVILLSPACASFDMFRDYADRGARFKSIVNRI